MEKRYSKGGSKDGPGNCPGMAYLPSLGLSLDCVDVGAFV